VSNSDSVGRLSKLANKVHIPYDEKFSALSVNVSALFTSYLLGERAVVLQSVTPQMDVNCQRIIWRIAQQLREQASYLEIVPGMNNLTVQFDPKKFQAQVIIDQLQEFTNSTKAAEFEPRDIQIPVKYGGQYGPDLTLVAAHCQLTPEQVIELHSTGVYLVYFLGFQPGFAYLGGLAPQLTTPRRAEPRIRIEAGAVGIGGNQTGIYPSASPGGWQIIGQTNLSLFDAQRPQPSLLQPGDIVRFIVEHW
jgi:KipI family sensor histidine kinase inhibitor